jgi:tripartite-type tricarboxylate transporter receptor subunit TctC
MRKMIHVAALCVTAAGLINSAYAQSYPTKPIRFIVATAPGGLLDVPARLAAEYFERTFGHRVLLENRGGAGGNVGAEAVAKATPDGYTLGVLHQGVVAINPFLYKDLPFDPLNDFAPVAALTSSPVVVAISGKLPVNNLQEFIALARRDPGKINYGTAGQGSIPHLAGVIFAQAAGIRLTQVHYKGAGPALTDLLGGQVQAIFVGLGVVRAHVATGALKVLAVSQDRRLDSAPTVPTSREAGLPGFELVTWFGLFAPKGTPGAVVAALVKQVHAMQDEPAVLKRLTEGGLDALKEAPEQLGTRVRRDYEQFRGIVKAAGIEPE